MSAPEHGVLAPQLTDAQLACRLAEQAGAMLCRLREELGFADPARLKAAGDRGSHELLLAQLQRYRPGDQVLSEEGETDSPDRSRAARLWIVDPLDGTREFSEAGRVDWAVHVALWEAACPAPAQLSAGAVALPAQQTVLGTHTPPVAPPASPGPLRLVASRTRPPEFLARLAGQLGAELVPMGSAGAKIAAVVCGTADAYVHAGGQYEWDSAAPVAVALAAGLHASRIDGSPLRYNQPHPWLPDLLVCRAELAGPLLDALGGLR